MLKTLQLIIIGVSIGLMGLGCQPKSKQNQSEQVKQIKIDTSQPNWQAQITELSPSLSAHKQQLLRGYILRQINTAKDTKTVFVVNINKAVKEQKQYQTSHPFNPTVKKLSGSELFPVVLLAMPSTTQQAHQTKRLINKTANANSNSDAHDLLPTTAQIDKPLKPLPQVDQNTLNKVHENQFEPQRWQFALVNLADKPIKEFSGTLTFKIMAESDPLNFSQNVLIDKSQINVVPTQFLPAIASRHAGSFVTQVPAEVVAQSPLLKKHADSHNVHLAVKEGSVIFTDGSHLDIKDE